MDKRRMVEVKKQVFEEYIGKLFETIDLGGFSVPVWALVLAGGLVVLYVVTEGKRRRS